MSPEDNVDADGAAEERGMCEDEALSDCLPVNTGQIVAVSSLVLWPSLASFL